MRQNAGQHTRSKPEDRGVGLVYRIASQMQRKHFRAHATPINESIMAPIQNRNRARSLAQQKRQRRQKRWATVKAVALELLIHPMP